MFAVCVVLTASFVIGLRMRHICALASNVIGVVAGLVRRDAWLQHLDLLGQLHTPQCGGRTSKNARPMPLLAD